MTAECWKGVTVMAAWTGSELLFYGGILLMAASAAAGIAAAVILRLSGKRLKRQLEEEFGKKRH